MLYYNLQRFGGRGAFSDIYWIQLQKQFTSIGRTSNGIKVLVKEDKRESSTPLHSNTPYTMYAKIDKNGIVNQITVYGGEAGRTKIKDIDIGHKHTNKDGTVFMDNEIHVHDYVNGKRNYNARKPSEQENNLLLGARKRVFRKWAEKLKK